MSSTPINFNVPTGIVVVVFGDKDDYMKGAGVIMEGGRRQWFWKCKGTFIPLATLPPADPSGIPFVDFEPDDGINRYYRAKTVLAGFDDSDYTATT